MCLPPTTVSSEMKSKVGNVSLKSVILKGLIKKLKEDLRGQLEKEGRVELTLDPNPPTHASLSP